ncbi:hypothetical protein T12_14250 [Trichinella patagoniensis]|uniref:Uncharacterized protein n=1 Tax=Trichinella patagoniensis TaxID=990121 RepID=A0A0V0Y1W6_9BILA|nr:hypothetical protein T12_14250 [Trichinella patagoniensis]
MKTLQCTIFPNGTLSEKLSIHFNWITIQSLKG